MAANGKPQSRRMVTAVLSSTTAVTLPAVLCSWLAPGLVAGPALADPIRDLTGYWTGNGSIALSNGKTERVKCSVLYRADGGTQILRAHVPQAELATYATELRSITGGRGTFSAKLSSYEEVPAHIAQKVIEAHEHEADADD